MRRVTEFMKQFEQASKFVMVDVDYATKRYVDMIENDIAVVLVLEEEGELIGSLGFIIGEDLHNGDKYTVETFWFTSPKRRGFGTMLVDVFEKYSMTIGAKKAAMIHMADSYPDRLRKYYENRGYILIEQHFIKGL